MIENGASDQEITVQKPEAKINSPSPPKSRQKEKVVRIKDLGKSKLTSENAEESPVEKTSRNTGPIRELTKENFEEVWQRIIQFLRIEKHEHSLANLLAQLDTIVEKDQITIEFATKAQKALFQEHMVDVRSRLVRAFGDENRLNLKVNAQKEIKSQHAITSEDQFADMAERNEYLHELKKRFGLEFE